jgi:hypothetical protein
MLDDVRWIASEGGPLLLLPLNKREQWYGVFGPLDPDNPEEVLWPSHYDSLCNFINDANYLDLYEVAGVEAISFSDEPLLTTTWRADTNLRYFAQVCYSNGLREVIHILQQADFPTEWQEQCVFHASDSEMILFDAALQGISGIEWGMYLRMPIGVYRFEHCVYTPTAQIKVNLYRMVLLAD